MSKLGDEIRVHHCPNDQHDGGSCGCLNDIAVAVDGHIDRARQLALRMREIGCPYCDTEVSRLVQEILDG